MARLPRGHEVLEKAQKLLEKAVNADDLRMLQAVVLPLVNGMSIQETAKAIGRGATWTTNARNKFIRCGGIPEKAFNKARNRAHMTKDEEAALLAPFFESARKGGILVVSVIREALEKHLGRRVAKASTYNLLHRHGWRKLAPDKRHVSADVEAQEDWKKNCQAASSKSKKGGKGQAKSG